MLFKCSEVIISWRRTKEAIVLTLRFRNYVLKMSLIGINFPSDLAEIFRGSDPDLTGCFRYGTVPTLIWNKKLTVFCSYILFQNHFLMWNLYFRIVTATNHKFFPLPFLPAKMLKPICCSVLRFSLKNTPVNTASGLAGPHPVKASYRQAKPNWIFFPLGLICRFHFTPKCQAGFWKREEIITLLRR